MANGPYKTNGIAKFLSNFKGCCFHKWCVNVLDSERFALALKAIKSLGLAISSNIFAKSGNEDSPATMKAGPIERAKKKGFL